MHRNWRTLGFDIDNHSRLPGDVDDGWPVSSRFSMQKKSGLVTQVAPDVESCKAGHDLQVNVGSKSNSCARRSARSFFDAVYRGGRCSTQTDAGTSASGTPDFPTASAADLVEFSTEVGFSLSRVMQIAVVSGKLLSCCFLWRCLRHSAPQCLNLKHP